jgi:hypothetical protein
LSEITLTGADPSPFEASVRKNLQRAFIQFMGPRILDYTTSRKIKFGRWVVEESRKIEAESHESVQMLL